VDGERGRLLDGLKGGTLGGSIVHLHLHHSPEVNKEIQHAHAPFSKIPVGQLQRLRDDLHEILERTAIRKQGCITLEVPSKDPFDYLPWLPAHEEGPLYDKQATEAYGAF